MNEPVEIEPGTLVPAVIASTSSSHPGQQITACIGIGLSADGGHGMIMEHSGLGAPAEMEEIVRGMLQEALERRSLRAGPVNIYSVTHKVERVGSCVAAVVLWWR